MIKLEIALIDRHGNGIYKNTFDLNNLEEVKKVTDEINKELMQFPQFEVWVRSL